jgi:hypothetical protein
VERIFAAMSACQSLHPDAEDNDSEGEIMFDGAMAVDGMLNGEDGGADEDDELDENGLNAQGRVSLQSRFDFPRGNFGQGFRPHVSFSPLVLVFMYYLFLRT